MSLRRARPVHSLAIAATLPQVIFKSDVYAAPSQRVLAIQPQIDQLQIEPTDFAEAANGARVRL